MMASQNKQGQTRLPGVSDLPCGLLLKALQFIPLLRQRGLQVQISAIVGQLQGTVIELVREEGREGGREGGRKYPLVFH